MKLTDAPIQIFYSNRCKCWFVYHKSHGDYYLLFKQPKVPLDSSGERTLALISFKLAKLGFF